LGCPKEVSGCPKMSLGVAAVFNAMDKVSIMCSVTEHKHLQYVLSVYPTLMVVAKIFCGSLPSYKRMRQGREHPHRRTPSLCTRP
jgi:hypothetical protein